MTPQAKRSDKLAAIEDAVAELRGRGIERIVALVLAPHFSSLSVGQYLDRGRAVLEEARRKRAEGRP